MHLISTSEDLRTFEDNPVWKDIKTIVAEKILGAHIYIEREKEHNNIIFTQGEISAFRDMLSLPSQIIEYKKEEEI